VLSQRPAARQQKPSVRAVVERAHRRIGEPAGKPEGDLPRRRRRWPDPAAWAESAEKNADAWWPDFVAWLGERSGSRKAAPDSLGGPGMMPIEPAPGSYVLEH
jgi:polyhydroxyalkanoate synthase subunit PhaC